MSETIEIELPETPPVADTAADVVATVVDAAVEIAETINETKDDRTHDWASLFSFLRDIDSRIKSLQDSIDFLGRKIDKLEDEVDVTNTLAVADIIADAPEPIIEAPETVNDTVIENAEVVTIDDEPETKPTKRERKWL